MDATATWDAERDRLIVRFRYSVERKERVKALAGARFDWTEKYWWFSERDAVAAIVALAADGFDVAQAADALEVEVVDVEAATMELPRETVVTATDGWTIQALNRAVGDAIRAAVPGSVWLVATVEGYDRARPGGAAYFELVERDASDSVVARVSAILWQRERASVVARLASAGIALTDGLAVRVRARVDLYAASGRYQVVIDEVDPGWSAGALAARRERVLAEVRATGRALQNVSLSFPLLPLRVALLTSRESDAYHDVLSSLRSSTYAFEVDAFDVRVQGDQLAPTVIAALRAVASRSDAYDVVVITRGGGSRVELGSWDDVAVALAVVDCPVKVIVAIGHQQDQSSLDALAHSCKTPTEAGETLVACVGAVDQQLRLAVERLDRASTSAVRREQERLLQRGRALAAAARSAMAEQRVAVTRTIPQRAARAVDALLRRERERLPVLSGRVARAASGVVQREAAALPRWSSRLTRASLALVASERHALAQRSSRVRLADPREVLARGFALVRDASGGFTTRASDAHAASRVVIEFQDGSVQARVIDDTRLGEDE